MRRVLYLYLPRWPIERRRDKYPADRPFVLAALVGNRRLVSATNAVAEEHGIFPGLPLTDAFARIPDLTANEADPAGDAAALLKLATWCGRYSPWTAPHGIDGIALDITGCAHLRGGEERLLAEVIARFGRQGITCRAAIADTLAAASAVAYGGNAPAIVVTPSGAREALAPLLVRSLRLDEETTAGLEHLGLRRISDLYAIPRAQLAARFGQTLLDRLDQALGVASEPLSPLSPMPARWVRRSFAEPISTLEDLRAATKLLLEALCRYLALESLGARRLMLTLYRVDSETCVCAIGTARPNRDPGHLLRLFEERLLELDPGFGIEYMVLEASSVEELAPSQLDLAFQRNRLQETDLPALVDRLANRLGSRALGRFAPHESHVPERAQRFVPALEAGSAAWNANLARPVRLLPNPEPITAVAPIPDDPPILFRWRSSVHRVSRADGPERIAGEWWRGSTDAEMLRDYYRVEDQSGRRFWLYRAGLWKPKAEPRWFLHGFFA